MSFIFLYICHVKRLRKACCIGRYINVLLLSILQYLGFGVSVMNPQGRRAVTGADMSSVNDTTEAVLEQQERDYLLRGTEARDLIEFGMIPEFVGRFPVVTPFQSLTTDMLVRILTEPHNALIPQYQVLFNMDKVGCMGCRGMALYAHNVCDV